MKTLAILALAFLPQGQKTPPPAQTASGIYTIQNFEPVNQTGQFHTAYIGLPDLTGKTVLSAKLRVGVIHEGMPGVENVSLENPLLAAITMQSYGLARVGYPNPVESTTGQHHALSASLTTYDGLVDFGGTSGARVPYTDTGALSAWKVMSPTSVPTDGSTWNQPVWLQWTGTASSCTGGNRIFNPLIHHGASVHWEISYR